MSSSTPDWEALFKHRDYCSLCGTDITFDGECSECKDGLEYNEWGT